MSDDKWVRVADKLPPDGVEVQTKIEDHFGVRNIQKLKRSGNMWFVGNREVSMYIYYQPTHWKD